MRAKQARRKPSLLRPFAGWAVLLAFLPAAHADEPIPGPVIAIIVDDLGNRPELDRRVLELPGPVTCSFLPHTPYATRFADLALTLGKEAMLHLPMESVGEERNPGMLSVHMDREEFTRAVRDGLDALPQASGVNNHMGSLLTQSPRRMQWLMDELARRGGLYFIDSYTSVGSVAWQVALANHLPSARRDVFLDASRDPAAIRAQFRRLIARAWKNGYAIAIAHPYPETVAFLEAQLPALEETGVELVPASQLIERRGPVAIEAAAPPEGWREQEENLALVPATSAVH